MELRRAADSLFDFTEMCRRALGRHWADRTAAERDEFVRLFTDLVARSYIGKIDRYAGEAIAYTAERVDGDEASVQSQVVTAKGSQIPVEYRLHRVNDDWTAYDVLIENVSLVGTYRSQFDRIIKTESFGEPAAPPAREGAGRRRAVGPLRVLLVGGSWPRRRIRRRGR